MNSSQLNVHSTFAQYFSKNELNPWLYQLSKTMEAGNICLDINQTFLIEDKETILNKEVLIQHALVGNADAKVPFILHDNKLYLHRFFHYERRLVNQIKALIDNENVEEKINKLKVHKDFISTALFSSNAQLASTDWQKVACINACINNFSIISGGPGTGKTTTVSKLLALLLMDNQDLKISICAPTGKAAARLEESISMADKQFEGINIDPTIVSKISALKATTIHSLLGFIQNSIHFKHNADNTLDTDVLIVDECSMIDMAMFYKLFQAIDTSRTKVILLGDKNQLASVDAGSVFRDLCSDTVSLNTFSNERAAFINSFINNQQQALIGIENDENESHPLFQHIIELQTSYRFRDDLGIGKLSKAVLNNDISMLDSFFDNKDEIVKIFPQSALESSLKHSANLLKAENGGYIGHNDISEMLKHITNSTILCAVKEGRQGVYAINNHICQTLFKPSSSFYAEQLLMVTKNQNREGIYNGDMGLVLMQENKLEVYFQKANNTYLKLSPAQIMSWETAFAMTIHKSQGSEFNEVLIVLPDNKDNLLLTRELLYTAITRAKKKVTIIGSEDIIKIIASQTVKRVSGIAAHF